MKNLLTAQNLTKNEVLEIFRWTDKLKKDKKPLLKGKMLAMIFEKPSLRTKVSFEVAMEQLGGHAIFLSKDEIKLGERESVADVTRVLSRYVDCIMARLFEHEKMLEIAKYSTVPVINGLDNLEHPCQALTDLYTIKEIKKLNGLKIVFLGDGTNNTFNSLIPLCDKFGMNVIVSCHENYKPKIKARLKIVKDPKEAVKDADVIYTDVFISMGQEAEKEKRERELKDYQLNKELLKLAKKDAIVLHPLPAHRGMEVTSEVLDSKNSVVFDQAENRLHVQKAILYLLIR